MCRALRKNYESNSETKPDPDVGSVSDVMRKTQTLNDGAFEYGQPLRWIAFKIISGTNPTIDDLLLVKE